MSLYKRIPSLDGLRAISIMLVICSHSICARGFPHAEQFAASPVPYYVGNLGVRVFFAISGFLITSLLLRERESAGDIDLPAFFKRRALRILPVFYSYIAVIAVLTMRGVLLVPRSSFVIAGTFSADLFRTNWYFGHFWSLSVEEHFYIFWPLAVSALHPRWTWRIAAAAFLICPMAGALLFLVGQDPAGEAMSSYATVAAGCLLALARTSVNRERYSRALLSPFTLSGCLLLAGLAMLGNRYVRFALLAIAATTLIVAGIDYITSHEGWTSRVLNWRPMVFVGTLSYSLYIWQELFLRIKAFDFGLRFPLNVVAAIVTAVLSYYLIERPFIKLKHMAQRKSQRISAEA